MCCKKGLCSVVSSYARYERHAQSTLKNIHIGRGKPAAIYRHRKSSPTYNNLLFSRDILSASTSTSAASSSLLTLMTMTTMMPPTMINLTFTATFRFSTSTMTVIVSMVSIAKEIFIYSLTKKIFFITHTTSPLKRKSLLQCMSFKCNLIGHTS